MIGSTGFALGSVPAYASAVGTTADAATFFVSSIFFTLASFGQLVQAQSPALAPTGTAHDGQPQPARLRAWLPHDRDWLAAVTQFPGTLFFNATTLLALVQGLTAQQYDRVVWRPDFYGSVLFLVSSTYAVLALGRFLTWRPRSAFWRIAWLEHARFDRVHGVGGRRLCAAQDRCGDKPGLGEQRHLRRRRLLLYRSAAHDRGVAHGFSGSSKQTLSYPSAPSVITVAAGNTAGSLLPGSSPPATASDGASPPRWSIERSDSCTLHHPCTGLSSCDSRCPSMPPHCRLTSSAPVRFCALTTSTAASPGTSPSACTSAAPTPSCTVAALPTSRCRSGSTRRASPRSSPTAAAGST